MTEASIPYIASEPEDVSRWLARPSTILVLMLALAGRLLVLFTVAKKYPHNWLFSHPLEMGLLANSLIHGLGYSSPFGAPTGPTAFIAPGYPTLIAVVFFLFGVNSFASEIAIISLQTLIGLLTIWLMMHLARKRLDNQTAILAGIIWATAIPLLWIPAIFWETSLSACSLPAMVLLCLRCRRQPTVGNWIFLGVFTAVAALINPALLPSMLAMMGWVAWQTRGFARTLPLAGVLALALVLLPWTIRNANRFHAFIPVRGNAGADLWVGNRPGATGFMDEHFFPMYNKSEMTDYVTKGEALYAHDKSTAAWQYIRNNPSVFIRLSLRRAIRFWSGTGSAGGPLSYEIHALFTTVFGFIGICFLYRNGRRDFAALLALPLLLFPLPYYITHAEFRYRVNIDPLLTLLAAYAITQLAAAWWYRRRTTDIMDEVQS